MVYVLDKNEAKSEKLVTEGWLQGKCTSASQGVFTALNNTNELQIGAAGMPSQEISGAVNNGDPSTTTNFALCEFKFRIPANALHGQHAFYIVVKYYFV